MQCCCGTFIAAAFRMPRVYLKKFGRVYCLQATPAAQRLLCKRRHVHVDGASRVCAVGAASQWRHRRSLTAAAQGVPQSSACAAGVVVPILGCRTNGREVLLRERFFLGGVSSLRGFAFKGVGPRAQRRGGAAAEPAAAEDLGKPGGGKGALQGLRAAGHRKSDALGGDLFATVRAAVRRALAASLLRDVRHCTARCCWHAAPSNTVTHRRDSIGAHRALHTERCSCATLSLNTLAGSTLPR